MSGANHFKTGNRPEFITAFIVLLLMAFLQCYKTTHDLHWAWDSDFDRDMAFIQNTLNGHFGKDPNYLDEFLWYNPLLFSIETVIVKVTGLPINTVVTQAGAYLNLLSPVFLALMLTILFDFRVALASLLSYLFLSSGNLDGTEAATYSPWLYPDGFMQFIFYLNIILCYKSFSTQKYSWFLILGIGCGVSFLGHAAPTIITILILISIQGGNIISTLKQKKPLLLQKYLLQGLITFLTFIIISFPLLYFIIGKYHLHVLNNLIAEYRWGKFIWSNFFDLVKSNLSVSFIISIIGLVWFYKNFPQSVAKKIVFSWLSVSVIMYIYTTMLPGIHSKIHINLPDTVPSYHYFFYLKPLQSIFFAFGLIFLITPILGRIVDLFNKKTATKINPVTINRLFIIFIVVSALVYFPFYRNRADFTEIREKSLKKESDTDKIDTYNGILQNIAPDKVILCEEKSSIFPVMGTARKMVCNSLLFSNPYVDYDKRDSDRNNMLYFLKDGQSPSSKKLFNDYDVSYVLLPNTELTDYHFQSQLFPKVIFKNKMYTMFGK